MVSEEILTGVPDCFMKIIEDNSEIQWEEKGKEFRWKDEFYDVVRIKKINNKTFLYCLNDLDEEQLVRKFAKTIKTSTDNERKNNKHSFKYPVMDQHIICFVSLLQSELNVLHTYFNYEPSPISTCSEIIIPPPRKFIS